MIGSAAFFAQHSTYLGPAANENEKRQHTAMCLNEEQGGEEGADGNGEECFKYGAPGYRAGKRTESGPEQTHTSCKYMSHTA